MTELEIRHAVAFRARTELGVVKGSDAHRYIVDIYNSYKPRPRGYKVTYTDEWCAAFVSYVSIVAGLTDIMPVECSCTKMIELYEALGRWVEDDAYVPQVGDIPMYFWRDGANYADTDQQANPNHVGIVVAVEGDTITVVEGNTGSPSQVGTRKIKVNGRYIRGYCCPDYASRATVEATEPVPWYQAEAEWVKAMGLADGTRGGETATRAEVWTMLHRLYDILIKE